jgi:hypothetical protein
MQEAAIFSAVMQKNRSGIIRIDLTLFSPWLRRNNGISVDLLKAVAKAESISTRTHIAVRRQWDYAAHAGKAASLGAPTPTTLFRNIMGGAKFLSQLLIAV